MANSIPTTTQPPGEQFGLLTESGGVLRVALLDGNAVSGTLVVPTLAALALLARVPNGSSAYVIDQGETYRLDTTNSFTLFSPLIIASASGGRWFRRSKAYVVGNFTLWAQSYGFGVVGFTPGQQVVSSISEPEISLDMTALIDNTGNQQAVITDALGNLWFICNNGGLTQVDVYKFALANCLSSGTPTPDLHIPIVLGGGEQTEAAIALFDRANGALWVATSQHGPAGQTRLQHYGPKAYATTPATPDLTIIANAPVLNSNQQDAVFDGSGNMWCSVAVATGPFNGGIIKFTAAQLAAGGSVAPAVQWTGANFTGPALGSTVGMAVGANNLLWVANFSGTNNVRAYDMAQPTGNPAPVITLTSAHFANGPYWLEFDASGNLWVNNGNANGLMRIPKAQLAASGVVVPDVVLTPLAPLTSKFTFPNNPDRVGMLPSGSP